MSEFRIKARAAGWMLREIRVRWGISTRQMTRISQSPGNRDWDALAGLPEKVKKPKRVTTLIKP